MEKHLNGQRNLRNRSPKDEISRKIRQAKHPFAFARTERDQIMIAVVPRLITGLLVDAHTLPFGKEVWRKTWVALPSESRSSQDQNIFTGEVISSVCVEGRRIFPLARIFDSFPAALLEPVQ